MKYIVRFIPLMVFMPSIALAQGEFGELSDFFENFVGFINDTLVPLVFAVAFLVFIWGVFQYFILGGADDEKKKAGRSLMLYGIGGFVLMVSVWGIVNLLANGFGFTDENIQNIPDVRLQND